MALSARRLKPQRSKARATPSRIDEDLLRAAYRGDLEGVRQALAQGANVNAAQTGTGLTSLHLVVGIDNLSLTRYVVEEAKAQFGPDGRGRWPSSIAAHCRVSEELCDYIVEKEAGAASETE